MRAVIQHLDPWFQLYLRGSYWVIKAVAIGVLSLMVMVYSVGILRRIVLSTSFSWAQEVSIIAAMWLYFFAYALIAKEGDYIRVELFVHALPRPVQTALNIATRLLLIGFFGLVAVLSAQTMAFAHNFTTTALELPESAYYVPLALGALDVCVTEIIYLLRTLAGQAEMRPGRATAPG